MRDLKTTLALLKVRGALKTGMPANAQRLLLFLIRQLFIL